MKITSSLDGSRIRYDAMKARKEEVSNKLSTQQNTYRSIVQEKENAIAQSIEELIGPTSLAINIRVDTGWDRGYEVVVQVNENRPSETKESAALSWRWEASIRANGEIKLNTNSWSGLSATTPAQLADLKESVRVIEILQSIDWNAVLNQPTPKYTDYIDTELSREEHELKKEMSSLEDEMEREEFAQYVGTNEFIKVKNMPDDSYYNGFFNGYVQLVSETASYYTIKMLSYYYLDRVKEGKSSIDDVSIVKRKKKELVYNHAVKPIEILEV